MNMVNIIKVGMADLNIATPPYFLRTTGLGSCVGINLYDSQKKIAGMAHIMLPFSEQAKATEINKLKFADTAIPLLIEMMEQKGAKKERMVAKLVGGAQMFQFTTQSEVMRIGPRNVEASKLTLQKYHISIVAEDTGGSFGRTIELDSETGKVLVKTVNQGEKWI